MGQLLLKTVEDSSKKKKIEFKYDLAILFLDIYPKQLKSGSVRDKKTFLDRRTLWLLLSRFF